MKISKVFVFGTVVVLIGLFFGPRFYVANVVDYPDQWGLIEPGMTSVEARELLGEPRIDGRGLKSLDGWRVEENGVRMHLDLWFEGESDRDVIVERVVMWKLFWGMTVDKNANPPWS